MKITRFSQSTPPKLSQPDNNNAAKGKQPTQIDSDIQVAYQKLVNSIGAINESLQKIENSGAGKFFNKDTLIEEIQSGRIAEFDINKANEALEGIQVITQAAQQLNSALYFLKQNENSSDNFKIDMRAIVDSVVSDLNSGTYSHLVSGMEYIKANLTKNTGTTDM